MSIPFPGILASNYTFIKPIKWQPYSHDAPFNISSENEDFCTKNSKSYKKCINLELEDPWRAWPLSLGVCMKFQNMVLTYSGC